MQYLNDDMDELFKRAAESYPLNTNSADWNKVQAMLHPEEKKRRGVWWWNRRNYLFLLLLLPFFICNRIILRDNGIAKQSEGVATETKTTNTNKKIVTEESQSAESDETKANNKDQLMQLNVTVIKPLQSVGVTTNASFASSFKKQAHKQNGNIVTQTNIPTENGFDNKQSNKNDAVIPRVTNQTSYNNPDASNFERSNTEAEKTNEVVTQEQTNEVAKKEQPFKQNQPTPKPKRFYIGLMGGPDISTVKFQNFGNTGFEVGVIVGYEFSKKFAMEAGVFSDKKYYKSDGEYLNTSKVYMPANSKITNVNGNCRMIELPLNLKYAISTKNKHSWFATAGVSSYLMSKEAYDYDYLYFWNNRTVTYSKEYDNATKNWFSVGQISVGYTRQLGNNGSLRIEPYYKLPLKGLGYGELPISSLGVHIGVTKKLF